MLQTSLKLLKKIENKGFKAYIVGGFVRDYLLGKESFDVDITTDATPRDIKAIFKDVYIPKEMYGSVTVYNKNIRYEITTFRKEDVYDDYRHPASIEYISDLMDDLKRRDFNINTICMNSRGEIIDLLNGQDDLIYHEINTVGDSYLKFKEDALRILRAVRFATVLNFKLSDDVKKSIINTRSYLNNISYQRKKDELSKIFSNINAYYGIKLLLELGLDSYLGIYNLKDIVVVNDIMGTWACLKFDLKYPFSSHEKELLEKIRNAFYEDNLDRKVLYKYGLYVNVIAASLKGINKREVIERFNCLPISNRNDIKITNRDIMNLLNKSGGKYLKDIMISLENEILDGHLSNDYDSIKEYIVDNY